MKNNRLFRAILLLIASAVLLLAGCGELRGKEFKEEKAKVEQYLREKYGKEFVVTKSEYFTAVLGNPKNIRSYVYPKDGSTLEFYVSRQKGKSQYIEITEGGGGYLNALWAKQIEDEFKFVLQKNYGKVPDYYIYIDKNGDVWDELIKNYYGKSPDFNEVLNQYPEKVLKFKYIVGMILFDHLNENKKINEAEKILQLKAFFEQKKLKNFAFYVYYFDKTSESEIKEYFRSDKVAQFLKNNSSFLNERTVHKLTIKDGLSVKNTEDIVRNFVDFKN